MGISSARVAAVGLMTLLALTGCAAESLVPTDTGIGALHGRVGPGAPPDGDVPASLELLFRSGAEEVRTTALDGEYEIQLPVGTWSIRTSDAKACADDVLVQGATRQRQDLVYPGDCPPS